MPTIVFFQHILLIARRIGFLRNQSSINQQIPCPDKVDHKNLNVDVDFLKDIIPTAENLAIKFWEILEPKIIKGQLYEIKLYESARNYVVYKGMVCESNT